jgi:predicted phage terminase large subunit-like protein
MWEVIDLPALAVEGDPLGRKPGEALWPERFPASYLLEQQRLDPRGFQALFQGRPSTEQGTFFQAGQMRTYKPDELPKNLRYYVASDHAVSTKQDRDRTAIIPVGVDEDDNIYVLPDVVWTHLAADRAVETMLGLIQKYKPLFWWAERGQISKSIGPFLRKRMNEERVYCSIVEVTPAADKLTRAQAIHGRMSMGKVLFPAYASWWPDARDQLLKFPYGAHDDFVDALAYIGLGLTEQVSASIMRVAAKAAKRGTLEWLKATTRREELRRREKAANAGW